MSRLHPPATAASSTAPAPTGRAARWAVIILLGVLGHCAVVAQQTPKFEAIRKGPFRDIDQSSVQEWVQAQVAALFTAEQPLIAGATFYRTVTQHFRAADASTPFKDGLAQIVAETFVERYKAADPQQVKPMAKVYVLTALKVFGRPTAFESYRLALADPAPGVRLVAAAGLTGIRDQLEAQQWTELLADVRKAGVAEVDPAVRSQLYDLLAVSGNPRVADALPVVLAMIDARLTQLEQKGGDPQRPEAQAATWLARQARTLNNAQQLKDIALRIARLLTHAVWVYADEKPSPAHKPRLEDVIATTEAALRTVVSAARRDNTALPDVNKVMLQGGPSQGADMKLELNKWIGTAQVPGVLNQPPLSFEAGLGVSRPPIKPEAPAAPAGGTPATPPAG